MATVLPPLAPSLARTPQPYAVATTPLRGGARHLARVAISVLLLLAGDTMALFLTHAFVRGARDGGWAGDAVARVLERALPEGVLPTEQVVCAVLLALVVMNAYGAAVSGKQVGLRLTGASLGLVVPYWSGFWDGSPGLALTGCMVLASLTLAALTAERRLLVPVLRAFAERYVGAARVLLVGTPEETREAMEHPALADRHKLEAVGSYDPGELQRERGGVDDLCRVIRRTDADTMALCCGPLGDAAFQALLDAAVAMGCELVALRSRANLVAAQSGLAWAGGAPLTALTRSAARFGQLLFKRALDIVVATVGLLFVAPLMVVIAIAIKLESPGPVLFAHSRMGAGSSRFRCLKFRSMHVDAEAQLRREPALYAAYKANDYKLPATLDPRITRLGRILRATSLDELPQLWNVLRGEMSLVGPRPVVPEELEEYLGGATLLLSMKPGISGAWAVHGRSRMGYPQRARVELAYVRQWHLSLDAAILAHTVPTVLSKRGAH